MLLKPVRQLVEILKGIREFIAYQSFEAKQYSQ